MNIILCVIDTLRYDYVQSNGINSWLKTPNFDRLADRSLVFDRAFAASYPTIPHRTDVMTGRYAWKGQGPFHPWMPLPFNVPTLPRLLAEAGYATQLIHDTPHLVNGGHAFDWPFAAWSFVRGAEVDRPWIDDLALAPLSNWAHDPLFDFVSDDHPSGAIKRLLLTYSRAHRKRQKPEDWNVARLFTKAVDFLKDNARRGDHHDSFFLWLDCFDPHEPWDAPPDFVRLYDTTPGYDGRIDPRAFFPEARRAQDGKFPPGVFERQRALYAAKVSWVDHWFGKVLDALEETGLAENTALILTADHGTNLGERGGFGKTGIVNEQEAHVPLMVSVPGMSSGHDNRFIQPQDIFETVLGLAQVPAPDCADGDNQLAQESRSRSLALGGRCVDSWRGNPQEIVMTVFDDEWYINISADASSCRLYRYGSVEDVAARHPEVVALLREKCWDELGHRDVQPGLIDWLASGGAAPFSKAWVQWGGPAGWSTYWGRVYEE